MSQTCRVRQGQGIGGDKTKKRQQGDSSGALRNTLEICPCPLQVTLEQSTKSQGQVNHEEICVKSSLDTRNGKPSGLGVCQVQETKASVRQAATAEMAGARTLVTGPGSACGFNSEYEEKPNNLRRLTQRGHN